MPWDPVRDLLTMQERLESLFGRASPGWVPPVDLSEDNDRYLLTVEVSGLNRDDVRSVSDSRSRFAAAGRVRPAVRSGISSSSGARASFRDRSDSPSPSTRTASWRT